MTTSAPATGRPALTPGTRLGPYEVLDSARVREGWARSTARATSGSGAKSRSRSCPAESLGGPRSAPPLRAGSEGRRRPQPSQPPRGLRHRPARGRPLRRVRAARGRDAARSAWRARPASRPQGRRLRDPDRARPGRGPREGDRPPRPQAREPLRHPGRPRQDPRLRPGQARGRRSTRTLVDEDGATGFHRDRAGASWAPSATCRPSRSGACRPTIGPTSSPSARSSTRCSRDGDAFRGRPAAETMTAILKQDPPELAEPRTCLPGSSGW